MFDWDKKYKKAFRTLKQKITTAPVLKHFDPTKPIVFEIDSSDYMNSGILSQPDDDGLLYPIAFYSKNFDSAKCNYDIYNKELLTIICALEKWQPELKNIEIPIQVFIDYKNFKYFQFSKKFSHCQSK